MATVVGSFELADGVPDTGKVSMWPSVTAADLTPTARTITQGHVTSVLDETGSVVFDVLASDDDGWQLEDGAMMPYTVEWRLGSGYRKPYEVYLVGAGPHDLTTMLPIEGVDVAPYPVPGAKGDQGEVAVDSTVTGSPGSPALVEDLDPSIHKALLKFTIPEGVKGDQGEVAVHSTVTGAAGTPALVEDLDPSPNRANLRFTIPQGTEVQVGTTTTGAPGTPASVTDSDPSPNRAVLDFTIPEGLKGDQGEVAVDSTVTGDAGTDALVEDLDASPNRALLKFTVPQGTLVETGTTTTGAPGTPASVTDADPSPNRALLNFTIPRGDVGPAIGGILTTKGDLVARDAATAVRVPVGAPGQVLTPDAAAAAGVAWANPIGSVTLWADLPTYTTMPLGARIHVTSGLGVLYALRGPTGWVVSAESDTGRIQVTPINLWTNQNLTLGLFVQRQGPMATVHSQYTVGTNASSSTMYTLPVGWRPREAAEPFPAQGFNNGPLGFAKVQKTGDVYSSLLGVSTRFIATYPTNDAWPTTPPA